jgi:hypothetical protein
MKLFRYRRPSVKTILGATRAKKVKRDLKITAAAIGSAAGLIKLTWMLT